MPGCPRVAVIGAGSWGTTFGKILADGGAHVTMWARRPELAHEINEAKRNSEYLPGINLPREMYATHHLSEALEGAEQVYLSIPSQAVRAEPQGRAAARRRHATRRSSRS